MQARSIYVLFAALCLCLPAGAQEAFTNYNRELAQGKAFLPVYYHYVEAVKTQGVAGLKTLAARNFTLKWDKETRTGEMAFTELKKYLGDPPKGDPLDAFTVKLRRLQFIGSQAIVQTQETGTFRVHQDKEGQLSESKFTATWYWKQTWRKTPEGWRLAVWERGTEKLPGSPPAITYTVSWKPKTPDTLPAHSSGTSDNN